MNFCPCLSAQPAQSSRPNPPPIPSRLIRTRVPVGATRQGLGNSFSGRGSDTKADLSIDSRHSDSLARSRNRSTFWRACLVYYLLSEHAKRYPPLPPTHLSSPVIYLRPAHGDGFDCVAMCEIPAAAYGFSVLSQLRFNSRFGKSAARRGCRCGRGPSRSICDGSADGIGPGSGPCRCAIRLLGSAALALAGLPGADLPVRQRPGVRDRRAGRTSQFMSVEGGSWVAAEQEIRFSCGRIHTLRSMRGPRRVRRLLRRRTRARAPSAADPGASPSTTPV